MTPGRLAEVRRQIAAGYLDADAMETVKQLLAMVDDLQAFDASAAILQRTYNLPEPKYPAGPFSEGTRDRLSAIMAEGSLGEER